jgi:hypothetical protein
MARVGQFFQTARHFPLLQKLMIAMVPKKAARERQSHIDLTRAKLLRRMELGKERPDLVEGLLRKKDEWVRYLRCSSVN